ALFARCLVNAPRYRADVSIGLFDNHTVAETPDCVVVMCRPALTFAVQVGRQPQAHVLRELKPGREHADDGVDRATSLQVQLREVLRRSELLLPVAKADQNDASGPFLGISSAEIPPEDGLNTEDFEKIRRDGSNRRARRLRSAGNGHDVILILCNGLEA